MTGDPSQEMREGVVIVAPSAGRLLVIRRAEGILAPGAWCFVGGGIEPGEAQAAAVAREFYEEVGGRVRAERKVWEYTSPGGALRLHWWLATLLSDALQPNPAEVAELRWSTREEILQLPNLLATNRAFLHVWDELEGLPRL